MRTSRIVTAVAAAFALFLLTGCLDQLPLHSWNPNVNATTLTQYQNRDSYVVLGTVTAHTEGMNILGIVMQGKAGQAVLWDAAKEKYGDKFTSIKDICCSTDYLYILGVVYSKVDSTYVGTVVREK
jgi:hypothetical protein